MRKTMKPTKLSFAGCLALTMTLVGLLPKQAHAQTCYAEPYSKNRNFIQVSIDTHGMETNALLSDVSVEVSYRAGSNEAKKRWQFTDSSIGSSMLTKCIGDTSISTKGRTLRSWGAACLT